MATKLYYFGFLFHGNSADGAGIFSNVMHLYGGDSFI
jgi:hypothetical protein